MTTETESGRVDVTPRPGLVALIAGAASTTGTWRDRLVAEAADLTRSGGWASITMAKLADRVGVSRQTVYNEIGSKRHLGQALIMRELEVFLRVVDAAFTDNPDDLVAAIRQAATEVVTMARTNPLLHAVLSASHGAESDLLPFLTTDAAPLIDAAHGLIADHLDAYDHGLPEDRVGLLVDLVIRVVLSHVTSPAGDPEQVGEGLGWIAERVLDG